MLPVNECIPTALTEPECIKTWKLQSKEVRLIRSDGQLFALLFEDNVLANRMCLNGLQPDMLSRSKIYIDENNNVHFCNRLLKKQAKHADLYLLFSSKLGLLWKLKDRISKAVEWQEFPATFVSRACHRATWDGFENDKKDLLNLQSEIHKPESADKLYQEMRYFQYNFDVVDVVVLKKSDSAADREKTATCDLAAIAEAKQKRACRDLETKRNGDAINFWTVQLSIQHPLQVPHLEECTQCQEVYDLKNNSIDAVISSIETWEDYKQKRLDFWVYGGTEKKERFKEKEFRVAFYRELINKIDFVFVKNQEFIQKSLIWEPDSVQSSISKFCNRLRFGAPLRRAQITEKVEKLSDHLFPFYVIIQPKTLPCAIDTAVLVSRFRWAVTLICYKGSKDQHAEIIVQGINDGYFPYHDVPDDRLFSHVSHLRGENDIESRLISNVQLDERSEVWLIPSKTVKKMWARIDEQKKYPIPFSPCGAFSLLSGGGDSCITWALSHLRSIGIELGYSFCGIFCTQTKTYTRKPEYYKDHPSDYSRMI